MAAGYGQTDVNTFIDTIRGLGPLRLVMMAAVAASSVAFFIYLTGRLATPDMALLYGELDGQESGQIVAQLEQQGIPYKVSADGGSILVPADQVGRVRVAMAEQGLPSGGSVGYEIFDRSETLGTTSFVQNVNHLRALEGELARTIRSIAQVQQARVHLVLPKRELFSRDRAEPSASIVVSLRGGSRLSQEQIYSIQHLVAAAVQSLQPNDVSIVDSNGALLAKSGGEDEMAALATNAEEMQRGYETRLARTIEELLERSVGPGNVRAEVSAEMDFDRITENAEVYDPDGQVVRSTQTVEETADAQDGQVAEPITIGNNLPDNALAPLGDGDGSAESSSRIEETVNYEISRTVRTHVRESGLVRRLSLAVLVNGIVGLDADDEPTYEPRSAEEMEQLAALVRSATGFEEERGDSLEIVNLRFADLEAPEGGVDAFALFGLQQAELLRFAELLILGVVAILVLLLVVRPMLGRILDSNLNSTAATPEDGGLLSNQSAAYPALAPAAAPGLPATQAAGTPALAAPAAAAPGLPAVSAAQDIAQTIDLNQVEGRVHTSSVKKIGEIVTKHPDESVAIVRNWLYQQG